MLRAVELPKLTFARFQPLDASWAKMTAESKLDNRTFLEAALRSYVSFSRGEVRAEVEHASHSKPLLCGTQFLIFDAQLWACHARSKLACGPCPKNSAKLTLAAHVLAS